MTLRKVRMDRDAPADNRQQFRYGMFGFIAGLRAVDREHPFLRPAEALNLYGETVGAVPDGFTRALQSLPGSHYRDHRGINFIWEEEHDYD